MLTKGTRLESYLFWLGPLVCYSVNVSCRSFFFASEKECFNTKMFSRRLLVVGESTASFYVGLGRVATWSGKHDTVYYVN